MDPTTESIAERYDTLLYPGQTRSSAHPDRMATIARLYGLTPASFDGCRVLELGCGTGENLMSIAHGLPGADCVGIDIAARPVTIGNEMIASIGLPNLRLLQADVMDMPDDIGTFDYIIAHGLFSWVPPEVQTGVLELVRRHLTPNGIAFISYNAFPGWHTAMAARDLMQYHARHFSDPVKQIQQARGILGFVTRSTVELAEAYTAGLIDTQEKISRIADGGLYHDDLAEFNIPLYFHQFASMIDRHDLQFLAEADFVEMQEHMFSPEAVSTIRKLAGDDIVIREQFFDFLKGRRFRQSLVVRKDIAIDRRITPSRVMGMTVSSNCRAMPRDPEEPDVQRFELPNATSFSTEHPAATAVLLELADRSPMPIAFDDLHAAVWKDAATGNDGDALEQSRNQLADILLWTYSFNLVELRNFMPSLVATVSERPVAAPLARLQSREGEGVTNLLHHRVGLKGAFTHRLLGLLDGSHDRAALLEELREVANEGEKKKEDAEILTEIDEALSLFAAHALLLG